MSDINELFRRDPQQLTKEDIDHIITVFRQAQAQFNLGDKQAGNPKRVGVEGPKIEKIDLDEPL